MTAQGKAAKASSGWDDALIVGLAADNDNHDELTAAFDRLRSSVALLSPKARGQMVDRLTAHVCELFERQETLMRQAGYPDHDRHRAAHCFLLDQLNRHCALAATHPEHVSHDDVLAFVLSWLGDHIRGDDCAFGRFMAERGAS